MDISCRFNETGVQLFREGRGDEAFEMFAASLQVMLQTMGKTTAQMDPISCQLLGLHDAVKRALGKDQLFRDRFQVEESLSSQESQMHQDSHSVLGHNPVPPHSHMGTSCDSLLGGSKRSVQQSRSSELDPCLYSHAFLLSSDTCVVGFSQYIVAISTELYNMALCLQQGFVASRMSNCMERALVLYSFAGELLWNNLGYTMLLTDSSQGQDLSKLYCAVLNNAGYLLHQMGRFEWSQVFFQRLYQFLELLGPAKDSAEQKERDTFQLNVVVLYRTLTTAAAA